jgi:hypothetical protein
LSLHTVVLVGFHLLSSPFLTVLATTRFPRDIIIITVRLDTEMNVES